VCPTADDLTGILVGGREMFLCGRHLGALPDRSVRSFDELAALLSLPGLDRRAGADRRREERRMFPPRPELRRHGLGRRGTDPEW
jgi:hypothetical protein